VPNRVRDVQQQIDAALAALRMRGLQPVRIWLTRDDLAILTRAVMSYGVTKVRMRYRGLPVSVALPPARSRVVSADGNVEYV
jgi:hypothetical protein